MEVEGNLEEDEEDRHQFAGSGERSAEAVASVGEDGAGEVNSVLETPALTLRLLHTSHLTPHTSHLPLVLTPGKVKSVGSDETTFLTKTDLTNLGLLVCSTSLSVYNFN